MSSKLPIRRPPRTDTERILAMPTIRSHNVRKLRSRSHEAVTELAAAIIKESNCNDPFYMFDPAAVVGPWNKWQRLLPRVKPFYAVKCNSEPALLAALAALGVGFHCASPAEIEDVLNAGAPRERIIYANPLKAEWHLRYAAQRGVNLSTFDSVNDVQMIKKEHPRCSLLLGVKVSDDGKGTPQGSLGAKDGALPQEIVPLLEEAKKAGIAVIGVSLHVRRPGACAVPYTSAVRAAKTVFDAATRLGLPNLRVVNFGCGFSSDLPFSDGAWMLRLALSVYFPDEAAVSVIADPGHFFSESAFWLAVKILAMTWRDDHREYWINDEVYGSKNRLLQDHGVIRTVVPLRRCGTEFTKYRSTVFGPTCKPLDIIVKDCWLPEMNAGDWLVFPNMGAYPPPAGSNFSGCSTSSIKTHLCCSS